MLIELLEHRELLSAAAKPTVEAVLTWVAVNQAIKIVFVGESVGQRQQEFGNFLMSAFAKNALHADAAPAAASTPSVTLSMPSPGLLTTVGTFNPASLEPFGSQYTFTLSAKHPLNLFNITQKIGKEKLHFTGKLNSKLTVLTGVLRVSGPTNQVNLTYKSQ